MSNIYSFSNTLRDTPPRNPNKPPIIAVIISTASIWYASQDANVEKNVAHKMATKTWGRIFPNSILDINLIRIIKMRNIVFINDYLSFMVYVGELVAVCPAQNAVTLIALHQLE